MEAWYEHCRKESDAMLAGKQTVAGFKFPGAALVGSNVIHSETKPIYEYLCRMTRAGFFTMSSQPTANQAPGLTVRARQRAYVAGYAPRFILEKIASAMPKDVVSRPAAGQLEVSRDGPGTQPNFNWGGAMCDETVVAMGLDKFDALELLPAEFVDMDWERADMYLFDLILRALE